MWIFAVLLFINTPNLTHPMLIDMQTAIQGSCVRKEHWLQLTALQWETPVPSSKTSMDMLYEPCWSNSTWARLILSVGQGLTVGPHNMAQTVGVPGWITFVYRKACSVMLQRFVYTLMKQRGCSGMLVKGYATMCPCHPLSIDFQHTLSYSGYAMLMHTRFDRDKLANTAISGEGRRDFLATVDAKCSQALRALGDFHPRPSVVCQHCKQQYMRPHCNTLVRRGTGPNRDQPTQLQRCSSRHTRGRLSFKHRLQEFLVTRCNFLAICFSSGVIWRPFGELAELLISCSNEMINAGNSAGLKSSVIIGRSRMPEVVIELVGFFRGLRWTRRCVDTTVPGQCNPLVMNGGSSWRSPDLKVAVWPRRALGNKFSKVLVPPNPPIKLCRRHMMLRCRTFEDCDGFVESCHCARLVPHGPFPPKCGDKRCIPRGGLIQDTSEWDLLKLSSVHSRFLIGCSSGCCGLSAHMTRRLSSVSAAKSQQSTSTMAKKDKYAGVRAINNLDVLGKAYYRWIGTKCSHAHFRP